MAKVFRFGFLCVIVAVFCVGIYDYLTNFEKNGCEMTYMFEYPEYLKVNLSSSLQKRFPKYNLYLYGEGNYARELLPPGVKSKIELHGIPVLFIPGNAGSYRQVRSLGSVALRMADHLKANYHFNFFALDFNEEMSALFGPFLSSHTEFANECIKHILKMYTSGGKSAATSSPTSVVLVGHSMGGMVARALFTLPGFKKNKVHTIITQATPHQQPVVAIDSYIVEFYDKVNRYWVEHIDDDDTKLKDVTVFSSGGGFRDLLVRSGLTSLTGLVNRERGSSAMTMSVPGAWVSTDHLCHVWCKQLTLITIRALFDIVDKNTKQIAVNPAVRVKPFKHHFEKNPGTKQYKASYDMMIPLQSSKKFELRTKKTWKFVQPSVEGARYAAVHLAKTLASQYGYVAISNANNVAWVGGCSIKEKQSKCTQVGNFARYANMIPTRESNLKMVHLDSYRLDMFEYWAVLIPESKTPITMMYDMYKLSERNFVHNVTTFIDFFSNFPSRLLSSMIVVNSTKSNQIFYNISLAGLTLPLQAYTANLITRNCKVNASEGAENAVAKFIVPWSSEHTYAVVPRGENGKISLKLQTGRPDAYRGGHPELHLYLMPSCSYKVTIDIAWTELIGQFFRFYAVFLPSYITMQVLMALSWQLMSLEEFGMAPGFIASHTRWAQPYRVCLVATILRFLISYPEDDNFARFVGLPADDVKTLQDMNIWYPALPVFLYLFSYAVIGLYGHVAHIFVLGLARATSPLFTRCFSSHGVCKVFNRVQYVLLFVGVLASAFMCGTIGILITYIVYIIKLLSNCVRVRINHSTAVAAPAASANIPPDDNNASSSKLDSSSTDFTSPSQNDQSYSITSSASWMDKFNVNFSLVMLLLISVYLNIPSFITWSRDLSWGSASLTVDPSRTSGMILCIAAAMIIYGDFPFARHELSSVMGAIVYICCVFMVLYSTVSLYRVTSFINAILMMIGVPSLLLSFFSHTRVFQSAATKHKDE